MKKEYLNYQLNKTEEIKEEKQKIKEEKPDKKKL